MRIDAQVSEDSSLSQSSEVFEPSSSPISDRIAKLLAGYSYPVEPCWHHANALDKMIRLTSEPFTRGIKELKIPTELTSVLAVTGLELDVARFSPITDPFQNYANALAENVCSASDPFSRALEGLKIPTELTNVRAVTALECDVASFSSITDPFRNYSTSIAESIGSASERFNRAIKGFRIPTELTDPCRNYSAAVAESIGSVSESFTRAIEGFKFPSALSSVLAVKGLEFDVAGVSSITDPCGNYAAAMAEMIGLASEPYIRATELLMSNSLVESGRSSHAIQYRAKINAFSCARDILNDNINSTTESFLSTRDEIFICKISPAEIVVLARKLSFQKPVLGIHLRSAVSAVNRRDADSIRHGAHSLRELITQLLHSVAPDKAFSSQQLTRGHQGRPTRQMRAEMACFVLVGLSPNSSESKFLATEICELYGELSRLAHYPDALQHSDAEVFIDLYRRLSAVLRTFFP